MAPVSDGRCTEITLLSHNVCWSAAHVMCEDHDLHKSEVTLPKPWTMPDGSGCWEHGSRRPPVTSPSQTVLTITVDVPAQSLLNALYVNLLRRSPTTSFRNVGWRKRNQQDATNLVFIIKLLSQKVSGIIMPIFRRARLCITAIGVLHCNKRGKKP